MLKSYPVLHLLLISILLTACSLSASTGPAATPVPTGPDASYTLAVATVIAGLTQQAGSPIPPQGTQSSLPGETPAAQGTAVTKGTAVSQATQRPAPSATQPKAAPTATAIPSSPTPQVTFALDDPRRGLGNPTWSEPFQDGSNWFLVSDAHANMQVNNGKLVMTANNANNFDSWSLANVWPKPVNFYIEQSVTFGASCSGLDRYGFIFRASQDASMGYLLAFSCDGQYSLWTWDGSQKNTLVNWKSDPALHHGAGSTNRMGVKVSGATIRLYANGIQLKELNSQAYSSGFFGVFIGAKQTPGLTAQVTDVNYWTLP